MTDVLPRYFEILDREVKCLEITPERMTALGALLREIQDQLTLDYDKRAPVARLRTLWKETGHQLWQAGLHRHYSQTQKVWETIGMCVELSAFRPQFIARADDSARLHQPHLTAARPIADGSGRDEAVHSEAAELFKSMGDTCMDIPSIKIRQTLKNTLAYLESEARKPLRDRNHERILRAWRSIHPELKRRQVLKPLEAEPMKSKVLAFLKGA